jgi:hypothetical protein
MRKILRLRRVDFSVRGGCQGLGYSSRERQVAQDMQGNEEASGRLSQRQVHAKKKTVKCPMGLRWPHSSVSSSRRSDNCFECEYCVNRSSKGAVCKWTPKEET